MNIQIRERPVIWNIIQITKYLFHITIGLYNLNFVTLHLLCVHVVNACVHVYVYVHVLYKNHVHVPNSILYHTCTCTCTCT